MPQNDRIAFFSSVVFEHVRHAREPPAEVVDEQDQKIRPLNGRVHDGGEQERKKHCAEEVVAARVAVRIPQAESVNARHIVTDSTMASEARRRPQSASAAARRTEACR